MILFSVKTYNELSKKELYNLLRLRAEVFIVEQDCVYQDIDNKDEKALHVLGYKEGELIAYARVFKPTDYFEYASIGRVIVSKNERHNKYGYDLMITSIKAIKTQFNEKNIAISAQEYLQNFYNNLNFIKKGKAYLEDGISHIYMEKTE